MSDEDYAALNRAVGCLSWLVAFLVFAALIGVLAWAGAGR